MTAPQIAFAIGALFGLAFGGPIEKRLAKWRQDRLNARRFAAFEKKFHSWAEQKSEAK